MSQPSRIAPIDLPATDAHVKPLLDGVQQGLGMIPNLFRVAARSPAALEGLVALFGAVGKGHLDARSRESIALVVSEVDACDYCLSAHSALGARAGLTEAAIDAARHGTSDDPRRAALLALARATVEHRGRVGSALDDARGAGLSDADIVDVVANVALTVFTNYLNELAQTEIDFPIVRHHAR
jgi:uncharacterized peroxidase-related enzyme